MTLTSAEIELLLLNLDAALRVGSRGQFYLWVQGQLQGLISHQVLLCAARMPGDSRVQYQIDTFSRLPLSQPDSDPGLIESSGLLETGAYERRYGGALTWFGEFRHLPPGARAPGWAIGRHAAGFAACDLLGVPAAVFLFIADVPYEPNRHGYLLELVGPHLGTAFARAAQAGRQTVRRSIPSGPVLTERQLEILRHVQQGRSNGEIGALLSISPLTVKNHVQILLRKLNAQNRAQAVSFGIAQRLIQPRPVVDGSLTRGRDDPDDDETDYGRSAELGRR